MFDQTGYEILLKRVDALSREIEHLKRDLLRHWVAKPQTRKVKPSLFGSVQGGDITNGMIEEAKHALFRPLKEL